MVRVASVIAALACTGCSIITDSFQTNDFSGDQFPIQIERSSGAVVVGVRQPGAEDRIAVLDVLSPITVADPGPGVAPSISYGNLQVLGKDASGVLVQPRAQFSEAKIVSLHPCIADDCTIGPTAAALPYQVILGADALAGDAIRLRLADDQIFVLADIAGDSRIRSFACDAAFGSPYRGGGTMVIGGTEIAFDGRRVTLQTCLAPNPDGALQSQRGTDALLIASTSIGISMLGASTYERYRQGMGTAAPPPFDALPEHSVNLPSGPIVGRLVKIPSLALVAASPSFPRAPCRQVYAHHLLVQRDCEDGDDCPCENGSSLCGIPSMVEVAPATQIDVLIIPDGDPTLQALRTELRPDQAEVDGILGTDVMTELELDVDYPNDRVLARCTGSNLTCRARPELYVRSDRGNILACFAGLPGPILR